MVTRKCTNCNGELIKTQPIGVIKCIGCGFSAAYVGPHLTLTLVTWKEYGAYKKSNNLKMIDV